MRIRNEILLPIGALLAILCLVVFGAITLLARMAPAIEHIRGENLESIQASEEMLAALVLAVRDPERARVRFHHGYERARRNVTEPTEEPHLDVLERVAPGALAGNEDERQTAMQALNALAAINHDSTARADAQAQRLGRAGAWAAVILGLLAALFSVLAVRRLVRAMVTPIDALYATALAHQAGDPYRRVGAQHGAEELSVVGRTVDELLDRVMLTRPPAKRESTTSDAQYRALLHFLDTLPHPAAVVDVSGTVVAANQGGLARLAEVDPLPPDALGAEPPPGAEVIGPGLWLLHLDPPGTEAPATT